MKVKEVRFEKLFSLEGYNNERIGFTVELSEAEDESKVVAELFFKICQIEECLDAYRRLLRTYQNVLEEHRYAQLDVERARKEAEELKVELEKSSDELEHLQKAIKLRRVADELKTREEKLAMLEEELSKLEKAREELKRRIKNGEFTLEGLGIPADELRKMEVA